MRTDRDPLGTSPLADVAPVLEQLAEVYRYSAAYYTSAAVPPYAVVFPNRLKASQAQEASDQWLLARAERRPPMLSGGITLETYSRSSAVESALLESMEYLDAVVARVLQIPPSLLNVISQSSLTYSTTQGEFTRWLAVGLYPMFLARIEAAFTDMLARGSTAVFDTSNLTRMDFAGRIEAYAESVGAGIHTAGEVRALEGLPATPDRVPVPIQPNVEGL
jgi:phage portal protein BeeE